jgi:hypothetical protein
VRFEEVNLHFDEVEMIRNISVNDAIESGLMKKWVDIMLNGLMDKVSSAWKQSDHSKVLLSAATTSSDEGLLYYILSFVGAGENWSNTFDKAKELLKEDGAKETYEDQKTVRDAIALLMQKGSMKRVTSYNFALKNVFKKFMPIVQHVKDVRETHYGHDWDKHLQTVHVQRVAEAAANDVPVVREKATSAKKKEQELKNMKYMMAAVFKS